METLTLTNIAFIIMFLSVGFNIFQYFHKPQEAIETRQAVSESEVEGKAKLLAQQLQWTVESNERRFKEINESIKEAFALATNHTHSVEVKVDHLTNNIIEMMKQITRLTTIIDERIPKK